MPRGSRPRSLSGVEVHSKAISKDDAALVDRVKLYHAHGLDAAQVDREPLYHVPRFLHGVYAMIVYLGKPDDQAHGGLSQSLVVHSVGYTFA